MQSDIQNGLQRNLARVENLVQSYRDLLKARAAMLKAAGKKKGSGRANTKQTDLLRAAVVFLHASVEEVLRGLAQAAWNRPGAGALYEVPLAGKDKKAGFTLADLDKFRGKDVGTVIAESVDAYLYGRFNCNNVDQLVDHLKAVGVTLPAGVRKSSFGGLDAMMKRRHLIVHQADRNAAKGKGNYKARSISPEQVEAWIEDVRSTMKAVFKEYAKN